MALHSKQRMLIALRSFTSIDAAAKSMNMRRSGLKRALEQDPELKAAYEERRSRPAVEPIPDAALMGGMDFLCLQSLAERKKRIFFAVAGRDPKVATAALHARLNRKERERKRNELKGDTEKLEQHLRKRPTTPIKSVVGADRYCPNCDSECVSDPCEVCNRKTKGNR